jgi:hypothetical protein
VQSALSAAVREIQNLRRQLSASEARYVAQNKKCHEQLARQGAEHAMDMAALKRKVSTEVHLDREESKRRMKIALGQSEARHHTLMHQMKRKFKLRLETATATNIPPPTQSCAVQTDQPHRVNVVPTVPVHTSSRSTSTTMDNMSHRKKQYLEKKLKRFDTLEELAKKILEEEDPASVPTHRTNHQSAASAPAKFLVALGRDAHGGGRTETSQRKSAGIRRKQRE